MFLLEGGRGKGGDSYCDGAGFRLAFLSYFGTGDCFANVFFRAGANFSARLSFPPTYPLAPPSMTFLSPVPFHPNVYPNGLVCISILHPPEDDKYGYESAAERWSPVQTPETILLSVISLLHSPNDESPANVEAARLWREERREGSKEAKEFKRRTRKCVRESLGED